MKYVFTSAVTRGGNILTPEKVIISESSVTWRRRNKFLIGIDSISIPIKSIASVELDNTYWGANITIKSYGSGEIKARRFTARDAKRIKEILTRVEKR